MGVFNTAMPLGTIIIFNALSIIGVHLGWRMPIFLIAISNVIALLAFLLIFKNPPLDPKESGVCSLLKIGRPVWFLGLAWMWFNASLISFFTFTEDFFISRGYEVISAGFLPSIVMIVTLFLSPLVGYLVGKFGSEELFVMFGGMAIAILIFLISAGLSYIPLLILMGIFAAFVPAPTFSLPSKIVKGQCLPSIWNTDGLFKCRCIGWALSFWFSKRSFR